MAAVWARAYKSFEEEGQLGGHEMKLSEEAMSAAKEIVDLIKRARECNSPVLHVDIAGIIERKMRPTFMQELMNGVQSTLD